MPEPEIANRHPLEMGYLLLQLSERAEKARAAGDHARTIRYFRALAKAVPERSLPHAELCKTYAAAGQPDAAIASCRAAIAREGVVLDTYQRFAELALARDPLDAEAIEELDAVATHLSVEAPHDPAGHAVQCRLGLRLKDPTRLRTCTAALARIAPDDPTTLTYQWALAVQDGDTAEAHRQMERARSLGMATESIAEMERGLAHLDGGPPPSEVSSGPVEEREGRARVAWIAASAGTMSLLAAALWLRSRKRRRALV